MNCLYFVFFMGLSLAAFGQSEKLIVEVLSNQGEAIEFASVLIKGEGIEKSGSSNVKGRYETILPSAGKYSIQINHLGYQVLKDSIIAVAGKLNKKVFKLNPSILELDEVVISASRSEQKKSDAILIVSTLSPKLFQNTQSLALSEGLNFQSGVRVETNCQNCGEVQVRLNGLEGAYSQILINSRPVFSALNSVYGLDQIPTNIIERVEVVRGGGSALYGSNAIAGTINIITKEPLVNSWELKQDFALIREQAFDRVTNFNGSIVSDDSKSGITFYGMLRNRQAFDADGDGFSELVNLENNVFGFKGFFKPNKQSKIGIDFSAIDEYRRGGDRMHLAPHFTDITEELDHNTIFSGLNYDFWSKDKKHHFSTYLSIQTTNRNSFYGGLGGGRTKEDSVFAANAYGNTEDFTAVGGIQYQISFSEKNKLITGFESQWSAIEDEAPGFNRLIDQKVSSNALFAQLEQSLQAKLLLSIGARLDYVQVDGNYQVHGIERNVDINTAVFNPRINLKYNLSKQIHLRGGYAKGFRAPQAFNEDLHISSVAGEPKFVILSNELQQENSDSYTASINYQEQFGKVESNMLIEAFYTDLKNPFTNVNRGILLANGSILEEVENGIGATVKGFNAEVNLAFSKKIQFMAGFTIQKANFKKPQALFTVENNMEADSSVSLERFVRNPNSYGNFQLTYYPSKKTRLNLSGIYTGKMLVPKVVSDNGYLSIIESQTFMEVNFKISRTFQVAENLKMEFSIGMQNLFDSYQSDFDTGPQRDSDFIYGPARPRTTFISIRLGDFLL